MPRNELFVEVRCEEIPARMLQPAITELATRLFEELMARGLGPGEVVTGFTPRRLALTLRGLPAKEPDRSVEMIGPPTSVAFDADGNPTAALTGFAKRCGVAPEELQRVETGKGEYVRAEQRVVGQPTSELLVELLPRLLTEISWPKSMRWGDGVGPWVRPIHGIVALYSDEVVPFELFGVEAGDRTCGHPILSPRAFSVKGSADYYRKLGKKDIVVRFDERRQLLLDGLTGTAEARGAQLVDDPELLDRVAAVCEIPGIAEGRFDEEFLSLPKEVLTTSLRDHQSAFTVERGGELLPYFLTIMDRPDDPEGRVRAGNEWVVAARLADARFFYDEDRKVALAERARRLNHVTFHERLGSYAEKTEHIVQLSALLCEELAWSDEAEPAGEAARLLKADLTTEMVKEFTSLQGIIGGVYAREEGYPEAVWQAIYDQYRPGTAAEEIPRGRVGQITSLADRISTLAGMFGRGMIPTGSKDPYGLRRVAQGAVRIVLEGDLAIDLDLVAARALRLYGDNLTRSGEEVLADLRPFLYDRVRYLLGREGYAHDEIEAALAVGGGNLPDLKARADALHEVREEAGFRSVVLAAKRISNIIRDSSEHELEPDLFAEDAERDLYAATERLRGEVEEAEAASDYEECLRRIAGFAEVLDRFFVEVLVMDEDQALRRNRLALLQTIHRILSRTARLTEIVVDKGERQSAAQTN